MCKSSMHRTRYISSTVTVAVLLFCSILGQQITKEELRAKWDMKHVIRDMDHIRKDLEAMTDLSSSGEMSKSEILFYYISAYKSIRSISRVGKRMHDFDDNGKLDGLEIRVAVLHTEHHQEQQYQWHTSGGESLIAGIIDHILKQYDSNNDGYIEFAEIRVVETDL